MVAVAEAFDARLESARTLTPSVRELTFVRQDGAGFSFDPGQFVNLLLDHAGSELKRSYSIASPPRGGSSFDLAVTRVAGGPASELLHDLPIGSTVRAVGPSGLFTRDATDPSPALFVGTGTGLAPFRSMVHAAVAAGSVAPMWILLGVRHEADILYAAELEELARSHPNVRLHVTLSQPGPGWTGRRGYVQAHVGELLKTLGEPDAHVYICGLERMVKSVRTLCRSALGVGRKNVHQERYD